MSDANKAVFLSYAREDSASARKIADTLRAAGVEVWFDETELRGGDSWDANIRKQIKECALFVPVISAQTQARREGYFRREWKQAAERTRDMAEGTPFLLPVVVDATSERDGLVPDEFRSVQWTQLRGGEPHGAFCGRVKTLLETGTGVSPVSENQGRDAHATTADGTETFAGRTRPRGVFIFAGASVTLVASILVLLAFRKSEPTAESRNTAATKSAPLVQAASARLGNAKSIAVLPFANISDDKDANAFFADGMHEDILTNLSNIRELRVISRTTAMHYRDTKKTLRQIGNELGVAFILEGSVRRAGNKVRVTGQLINARTDEHVWAKNYDKELNDIFAIQAALAQEIAGALHAAISPQEKKLIERRPTENILAYDLFLKARPLRDGLGQPERRSAREAYLNEAVKLDPKFALAWAHLGRFHLSSYNALDRSEDTLSKANYALDVAVKLAGDEPEILSVLAFRAERVNHDYPTAFQLLNRAIQLQPNSPDSHGILSAIHERQGHYVEAMESHRTYARLEPSGIQYARRFVRLLSEGRRFTEAIVEQQRVIHIVPDDLHEAFFRAWLYFRATGSTKEVNEFLAGLSVKQANSTLGLRIRRRVAALTGNSFEYARLLTLQANDPAAGSSVSYLSGGTAFNTAYELIGRDEPFIMWAAQGNLEAANKFSNLEQLRSVVTARPLAARNWRSLAEGEAVLGNRVEALRCAEKAVEIETEGSDTTASAAGGRTTLAFVYAWTGDKERALSEYATLLRTPFSRLNVHEMKRDPRYHPLQGDPRFEALLNDPKNNAPLF